MGEVLNYVIVECNSDTSDATTPPFRLNCSEFLAIWRLRIMKLGTNKSKGPGWDQWSEYKESSQNEKASHRHSLDSSTAFFATYGVVRHAHFLPAPSI